MVENMITVTDASTERWYWERGLKSYWNEGKFSCTLETAMYRAMREKQYSTVASNKKVLMKLIGLEAKIKS